VEERLDYAFAAFATLPPSQPCRLRNLAAFHLAGISSPLVLSV
jgi:hypothetical protein